MRRKLPRAVPWPPALICSILLGAAYVRAADKPEESPIRAAAKSFVEAFDRGDAKAVAAHWTENGSLVDDQGRVFKGRKAIEEEYAAFFKAIPGVKMKVAIQSIEFPTPVTAVEDGTATVSTPQGGPPVAGRYTAVHVRDKDQWLMAGVREARIETASGASPLQPLEWLIGAWETKSEGILTRTSLSWVADKKFIQREYSIRKGAAVISSGVQIIGWDPQAGQIRSWSFDSSGGHGTGLWTAVPEGWRIETIGALADGTSTSSRDLLIRVPGEDSVLGWRSYDRRAGQVLLPATKEIVLDRAPEKR
jgi:uncharacterized protein (TIGR02246 family)